MIKSLNKKKFENFVIKVEKSKPAPRHKKDRSKKENYKARSSSRSKNRLRQSFAKRKYRKKEELNFSKLLIRYFNQLYVY